MKFVVLIKQVSRLVAFFSGSLFVFSALAAAPIDEIESEQLALKTLAGFRASSEELNLRVHQLLKMGSPLNSWPEPKLYWAVEVSSEVIGDCTHQLQTVDLNRDIYAHLPQVREDLLEEEHAAVLIHNRALDLIDQRHATKGPKSKNGKL